MVFPAHDYKGDTVSTIGEERRNNPRLQVPSVDAYIELKMVEVMRFEMTPHPVEFDMYYSV